MLRGGTHDDPEENVMTLSSGSVMVQLRISALRLCGYSEHGPPCEDSVFRCVASSTLSLNLSVVADAPHGKDPRHFF